MARVTCAVVALGGLGLASAPAHAEKDPESTLIGPVFGLTWGRGRLLHATLGGEAGFTIAPLVSVNAGVTWRDQELFAYGELDGWFVVGATAGVGYGTRSEWSPVVGVWELAPLGIDDGCQRETGFVISAGYRWTGLHELYVAPKYGEVEGVCVGGH
jgi:hypothetical protein